MSGFHPERGSVTGAGPMEDWLRQEVSTDLLKVPGVGPATVKLLKEVGITTTHQLFGKFLSLRDDDVRSIELADRFWFWLNSLGSPPGSRGAVVLAVAEKLNLTFTDLYDGSLYEPLEG